MKTLALAGLLSVLVTSVPLCAQPYPVPSTWGGDFGSRPRLTGDWGGTRDELGKQGVVLDADVYWFPQQVVSGGKDTGGGGWGNAIVTLNADTQKMGLWPGGFFKLQTVTGFSHNVYGNTGSIIPASEAWMLPELQPDTGLQTLTFMQFFSEKFGLVAGKINLLEPSGQFFGDYRSGFANSAINLPMALALVPFSGFGAGAVYLPSDNVTLSAMAVDPDGTIMSNDLGHAFGNGVMALAVGDVKIKPFGLPGHQSITLSWSNKNRVSLVQDPSNIARLLLTERFPRLGDPGPLLTAILAAKAPGLLVPTQPLNKENTTWAAVYGFEQYLWQPAGDAERGIGTFFNFGASDGRANPIKYSYSLGLVGKGVVPGRPRDDFGIAWAQTEFSDNFVPFLRNSFGLGLNHEDAVELYYSAAVTPWLTVSPSLQVIRSGLNKALDPSSNFNNLDTAYLAGIRVGIRF